MPVCRWSVCLCCGCTQLEAGGEHNKSFFGRVFGSSRDPSRGGSRHASVDPRDPKALLDGVNAKLEAEGLVDTSHPQMGAGLQIIRFYTSTFR